MVKLFQLILYCGKKLLLLLFLLLLMGGAALFFTSFEEPEKEEENWEKQEYFFLRKQYENQQLKVELLQLQLEGINKLLHPAAYWEKWKELQEAKLKLKLQKDSLAFAGEKYRQWQKKIKNRRESLTGNLKKWFQEEGWKYLLFFIFLLFIAPILWPIFMYYILGRIVEKFPPLTLSGLPENPNRIRFYKADTSLTFPLEGKRVFLRRGDWGKKRNNVTAATRFLWKWNYPLVSFAADLWELIAFAPIPGKEGASITITSPYPDLYVTRVDLNGSNGIVLRPAFLVGLTEDVEVETRWSFHIHNLLSGRIRQIILKGEGTLFLTGCWGLDITAPQAGSDCKIEDGLLIAYTAGSEYSLAVTETFWHYFRKQTSLFDQKLGRGLFITQNNRNAHPWGPNISAIEKIVGFFLNGVGKLLGF